MQREIETRIATFATELEALVRRAALDSVIAALGGRRSSSPISRPPASMRSTQPRRKGAKRAPKAIDALTARVASWIAANPGGRIEEASRALATPTKELALPIIRLLDSKTIRKTGQKRATKYFAR